ncbi:peripheral myelin protein 22-like [Mytilus edulis]|uniref:peripheral myelin protein 22-like n=1 Tax=Mytilus edulis TaxID=6550 RepID=UPI0039EF1EFC
MSVSLAEVPPMVIGGSIISVVSLIFHIIGFSTTYWYIIKNVVGVKIGHVGLWQECGPAYGRELCFDITGGQFAQFKATEALECLALVAFVAAVICAFLKMFVLKERGILFVVTGLLNLIAGVIALIGVIVFSTISRGGHMLDASNFHYSFWLCIVGGFGGMFSGIIFILAWRWVRN